MQAWDGAKNSLSYVHISHWLLGGNCGPPTNQCFYLLRGTGTFPGVLPSLWRPLLPLGVCAGMRRSILGNDPPPPLVAGVAGAKDLAKHV